MQGARKGIMRYIVRVFLPLILLHLPSKSTSLEVSKKILSHIENGKIFTTAKVNDAEKSQQQLFFKIAGVHPRSCKKAFRKLSRYENFHQYLDVVKNSSYDDQKGRINLGLSSTLLPFDMTLDFVIPRITKEGTYQFYFDKGFLMGLTGVIDVKKHGDQCLIISESQWLGKKSKIPNLVFEFFLNALGKLTMENLFRISKQ